MAKWVTSSLEQFAEDVRNYTTFTYNSDEQYSNRIHWSRQLHQFSKIEVRQRFPVGIVLGDEPHRMWINCIHKVSRQTNPEFTIYKFDCGPKGACDDTSGKESFVLQCM